MQEKLKGRLYIYCKYKSWSGLRWDCRTCLPTNIYRYCLVAGSSSKQMEQARPHDMWYQPNSFQLLCQTQLTTALDFRCLKSIVKTGPMLWRWFPFWNINEPVTFGFSKLFPCWYWWELAHITGPVLFARGCFCNYLPLVWGPKRENSWSFVVSTKSRFQIYPTLLKIKQYTASVWTKWGPTRKHTTTHE